MADLPLMDAAADVLVAFREESILKTASSSKRRWALLILALVGIVGGVYLARRLAPRTDVDDPNAAIAHAIGGE